MMRKAIESLVKDPLRRENAEIAARVYSDETAWPTFEQAFYEDAEKDLTDDECAAVDCFVATHCAPHAENTMEERLRAFVFSRSLRMAESAEDLALAAASPIAAAKAAPAGSQDAEAVNFVFVSSMPGCAWRAEMELPPQAEPDTPLVIRLTGKCGEPVKTGLFTIAGVALPVVDGSAELPYGMFLAGMRDTQVKLTDEDGVTSAGVLALF